MKKENKTRPARPPLHKVFSIAPCLMISLVLLPFQMATATDPDATSQPRATSISTVELVSKVEQFLGKQVLVRAKIGKVFSPHWFAIQDLEQDSSNSVLVLVTKPARPPATGDCVLISGCVRKMSKAEISKEYGEFGQEPLIEAEHKPQTVIVADSILTRDGENVISQPQPDPEEKLTPEQKKSRDVHRVNFTIPTGGEPFKVTRVKQDQATDESGQKTPAKISPEAKALLEQMRAAYGTLEAAQLDGQIQANVELGGQKQKMTHQFTSSFQAPNKFRHELEDGLVLGSTGEKTYIFQKSANAFVQQKAPNGKVPIRDLPSPIPQLLQTQNPSLLFAVIEDPVRGVTDNMKEISQLESVQINGQSYPALALIPQDGQSKITLLIDPQTHLLKRLNIEISGEKLKNGKTENGLQSIAAEIDYTNIRPQPKFEAEHFAWSPPDGAKDLAAEKEHASAQSLIGKPAPDFTLDTLDGDTVTLSDLKGQVVVLDFWATWCPPCVRSLPELDQLHQQRAGDTVRIFAVNLKENEEQVHSFLRSRGLTVPVLLDREGEVAEKFNVHAIPQTIIIGKDGEVRQVFVGAGPDTFERIRLEIETAAGGQEARQD